MQVNGHIARLPAAYLFADVARRVSEYEGEHPGVRLIRMGAGDATRPLAPSVARAFAGAAAGMAEPGGFFGYGPAGGYPFLKDAIIRHEYEALGVSLDRDEVFISDGAKTDAGAIQELFAPDARVAVADPVYPVYVDANAMAGRLGEYRDGRWSRLITLPCTHQAGFVPELPEEAEVLYLCSPNNPTGAVLTHRQLKACVDWAREREALIVFDAVYRAYVRDPALPRSIYEVEGAREVAVECCSFSKSAGFTGVRCAWTVIPMELKGRLADGGRVCLNSLWARRLGSRSNGVSYPVQRAAEAVYTPQGQRETRETVDYYLGNARILLDALKGAGCEATGGANSPYVWMRAPGGMSGWGFFDLLLKRTGVAGTPGEGFGACGAGCFRLTGFAGRGETIEAADRIRAVLNEL